MAAPSTLTVRGGWMECSVAGKPLGWEADLMRCHPHEATAIGNAAEVLGAGEQGEEGRGRKS